MSGYQKVDKVNTTLKKIYNSDLSHRRLQAFVRQKETLQGLASVPYRGESAFIDRVLQDWFMKACHPHSVEEMMESGELTKIITSFLEGNTAPSLEEKPPKKREAKKTTSQQADTPPVEPPQAKNDTEPQLNPEPTPSAPYEPVEPPKEPKTQASESPTTHSEPTTEKKDEGPTPDPSAFLNMF